MESKTNPDDAEIESYLNFRQTEKSKYVATYREFAKDHATIFSKLQPKTIYYISHDLKGKNYKIFNISLFDEVIDANKNYVLVSGRYMQNATLFFLQFARDTLSSLRIMSTKNKSYLIEPRVEALTWTAKRLGLSNRKALTQVVLGGGLQDILTTDFDRLKLRHKNKRKDVNYKLFTLNEIQKIEKLESVLANIRVQELAILQKLNRPAALNSKSKDERIRWQNERIAQLRQFITGHGHQIPSPVVSQASRYANRVRDKDQD